MKHISQPLSGKLQSCLTAFAWIAIASFCLAVDSHLPLHQAIRDADYQKVDSLIAKDADLNQAGSDGLTPLEIAVQLGDTALVRTLALKGASILPKKMMATAYRRRDNPTMSLLLNAGVDPNIELADTGKRLFDVAIAEDSLDTVRSLLTAKADPGDYFWPAINEGNHQLAETLLAHGGVDPRVKGPDGRTPLEYALQEKQHHLVLPILKSFSEEPSTEPWLSRAIRNGNSEISLALLKGGFPLGNQRAADNHSFLAWSIANEMDDLTRYLINAGVNVNIMEPGPAHPLLIEKFDTSSTFRKLLVSDRRIRPLMMAAIKRNHEIAQALVDAGAKNLHTSKYHFPISFASWYHDVKMMQIIFGRDPEVQPRKLVVDLSDQKVTLYENDKVTYTSKCSTGKRGYRTKQGTFVITQKRRHHVSNLYGSSMPYFMRLSCGDFGFHTGPLPGYPASHGCIRLPNSAASHYYKTCTLGDLVVIQE